MIDTLDNAAAYPGTASQSAIPARMPRRSPISRLGGRLRREFRNALGLPSFLASEDRRVLEKIILPHLRNERAYRNILFVGCDWYTAGYSEWFAGKNYWTIEIDPRLRKFGARQHIVDSLQNIARHFPANFLDVIICNGVFGWGLDALDDVGRALYGCHTVLHAEGLLIVGIDEVEERRPYALERCEALRRFRPYTFPPLQTADFLTDTTYRHRFQFYRASGV